MMTHMMTKLLPQSEGQEAPERSPVPDFYSLSQVEHSVRERQKKVSGPAYD